MTNSTDPNNPTPSKGKWPSGTTFLMYCAGVTLVLLAVSLVVSGKPFSFSVDGDKVTLHGGLIPQGVPEEKAKENSAKLQQEFVQAKSNSGSQAENTTVGNGPFNGMWQADGVMYELAQQGTIVYLSEITNGVTSAFGIGEVDGQHARVTIGNGEATLVIELFAESEKEIRVSGPGIPDNFYIEKL